uniref:putative cyclin-B3-1 n=1 Tax=Erigeron canadensis TaxID=72917 RepID=UPI001CB8EEC9|nr:putative cyclin-B3-1 [Erigeron canadensis]
MVVVKGLSTLKTRVSGERETKKIGAVRSLKVYTDDEKLKIRNGERVVGETKKSIQVKAETGLINANCQKEALNKLEMIKRKNISSVQTNVGRKVLADISNVRGVFQKNDTFNGSRPGKGSMQRMTNLTRASVGTRVSNTTSSSGKDLKVFNDVKRNFPRNNQPSQRQSFPVPKNVDKRNLEYKVKNKVYSFSVKPKVGTTVIPQVSNVRDYRWRNRASDGSIQMLSEAQPIGDAKRLSKISMKPTIKTTISIPRAQRASRSTSVFTKPSSANSVLSKKEATSRSSANKHTESISCEQNLEVGTSNITAKGKKSGRRRSYTSLLIESTKLFKDHGNFMNEEILPEIYDDCNQLEVAEYVDEIYQHYWVTEAHNPSLKNYMKIQTDITPQMRSILINWLIEVHLKFDLMQETLYLMVTLLDYYLSAVTCKRSEMQLVGLTSLLLASKYEDFWHPKVMQLIGISAELYTRDQMLEMETTILQKLNFRLNLPTPYVFMLRFLKAAQEGKKFENLAFYLIELCLVEYEALNFKPSLLCASAIYVARCTIHLSPSWTPLLCRHSHYQEFQLRDCAEMILRLHQAARKSVLRVTYDKFMSTDNCKVASIKHLDKLPPL